MKNFTNSIILIGGIIGHTLARNVKFSVISFGSDVKLKYGENIVQMSKPDSIIPLWTVNAEVPEEELKYYYFFFL